MILVVFTSAYSQTFWDWIKRSSSAIPLLKKGKLIEKAYKLELVYPSSAC